MMSEQILEVMALQKHYTSANTQPMKRRGELIRKEFAGSLKGKLTQFESAKEISIPDLWVEGKDGDGNKAIVPWVRLASKERSPSATDSWYVVFLFSAKGSSCFLSLGHASTSYGSESIGATKYQRVLTTDVAAELMAWGRRKLGLTETHDSRLRFTIDLESKARLAAAYERTSLCSFEYRADDMPSDQQIYSDLEYLLSLLSKIYSLQDSDRNIPGSESPEYIETMLAINASVTRDSTYKRRHGRSQQSPAQKKAIEEHAVRVAIEELEKRGFTKIKDVGLEHSYDISATLEGEHFYVEVKGTMSSGEKVIVTRNEVILHREEHPRNALIVVSQIELLQPDPPVVTGGEVLYLSPWKVADEDLEPLAFDYTVRRSNK